MTAGFTAYSSVAEEALLDLLRIGLNYYLQPDDAVSDATDIVTLEP